ncbi:MAG TPA: hypothetical protein VD971_01805 [Phycisphaerales bacterium]|nr:hypothetical protein [Phycisphaerales bacterium]
MNVQQTQSLSSTSRLAVVLLGGITQLCFVPGCIYLHDPARQKTAEEARDEFAKLSHDSLAALQSKVSSDGAAALTVAAELGAEAEVAGWLREDLAALIASADRIATRAEQQVQQHTSRRLAIGEETKRAAIELGVAQAELADRHALVNAAARREAEFVASQELLAWSVGALASRGSDAGEIADVVASYNAMRSKAVAYSRFTANGGDGAKLTEVDASATVGDLLNLPAIPSSLAELDAESWRNLKEVLGDGSEIGQVIDQIIEDPSAWQDVLKKSGIDPSKLYAEAVAKTIAAWGKPFLSDKEAKPLATLALRDPGASLIVASLGYDMALAQQQRLAALVGGLRREDALRERVINELNNLAEASKRAVDAEAEGVASLGAYACDRSASVERILADFSNSRWQGCDDAGLPGREAGMSEDVFREKTLALALAAFDEYVQVRRAEQAVLSLEAQLDSLQANMSAAQADALMTERQALISRGLEGLVAFHSEGVKPDDLIQAAQVAALLGVWSDI